MGMRRSAIERLKVGDTIKIHTWHGRVGYRTAIRKIVSIDSRYGIAVNMFGCRGFYLRKGEILEKVN
jgi:hypothetical protein